MSFISDALGYAPIKLEMVACFTEERFLGYSIMMDGSNVYCSINKDEAIKEYSYRVNGYLTAVTNAANEEEEL